MINTTEHRLSAVPQGVGVGSPFYAERAKNAEIWTTDGKRYIDFAGGIGVLNTGHLHPKVQAAVAEQLQKFSHTCYHVVPYALYADTAARINALTPIDGDKRTMFVNSGAEAVENAIKIARAYTKRRGVIAFNGAFHGRTHFTLGLTGKIAPYKLNFGPFSGDIVHAPYPNELHGLRSEEALAGLDKIFKCHMAATDVAAIIIEVVQGEGGFNITPFPFLKELRRIADENGIVLIFDEVQTGFARTGKLFATEHTGVSPDIITMAKSMAGGFTLSGVCGKADIMNAPTPGGLGGTYGGNPLGLAAANAVMDVIEEEKLCERSVALGNKLKARFEALKTDIPAIRDVRGLGSMAAIELMKPNSNTPDADLTKKIQALALEKGLIILTCGTYYNVIRFLYPLTIEDAVFDEALDILEAALKEAQ
ncbi:4-aminobutyrate--2-oxoglutarate transaminase [Stenoxybacter acetivorans]|uniref:4-aminobutyrate--2-oxoglutarate transaminase n=1 Tax=Stenoxybacter acetivorans TaxID=422441 RepID=UPI00056C8884|nr:4-aminobutyrate--2-oxoglutarate transaminase [Stenoxybacter acetivorans]